MNTWLSSVAVLFNVLGGNAMQANYAVWTASSMHKVLKTDRVEAPKALALSAARNEHEAFQVVLRSGRAPLEGVKINVSDLVSKESRIAASNVTVYLPAYIHLPKLLKDYPDPLPPYREPFYLNPGQTQPIWIDIYVPNGARPGDYTGTVEIIPSNGAAQRIPFALHVYGFELPVDSKLATAFGVLPQYVAEQHGVKPDSLEAKRLHKAYYEFLLDRGVSTYQIPADLFSDEGAKYLRDPRLTSFVVDYTTDEAQQRRILDRVREMGAWDKGFFYFVDEPVNEDAYKKLQEGCTYLHKIDPKVNIVSPYHTNPAFTKEKTVYDLLAGYIDIWCFNTGFYDGAALDLRRKAGDTIWNYVCCGPGEPYANFFVQYAPIQHRILMWQNYLHDVTGLLYWSTTYWAETSDPWTNVATWGGLYGDGSLLYPGKKVGIDGPVTSIRLESIRDGLEDYKYLWLLEQKTGRDAVIPYVRKLTQSWTEYTRDPARLVSVRDEIARAIESATQSKE